MTTLENTLYIPVNVPAISQHKAAVSKMKTGYKLFSSLLRPLYFQLYDFHLSDHRAIIFDLDLPHASPVHPAHLHSQYLSRPLPVPLQAIRDQWNNYKEIATINRSSWLHKSGGNLRTWPRVRPRKSHQLPVIQKQMIYTGDLTSALGCLSQIEWGSNQYLMENKMTQ